MNDQRRGARVLPPGQRRVEGFPRFGTHLHKPPPVVPADHHIEVSGAVTGPFAISLTELAALPRLELTADFHCVAGWSATDLHWEGVAFATFYRAIATPALQRDAAVTHVVFRGLDGYESIVCLEDALQDDVLLADHLDGRPLDGDHGAPVRLVSPGQYGFVSIKHLSGIELHTRVPTGRRPSVTDRLLAGHPRARVWREERHGYLPAWAVRPVYRLLIRPIAALSACGSRQADPPPQPARAAGARSSNGAP